ncbi:hypothetical protein PT974_01705 [Cladobotryum mycophilum]|uniref:Heterokaryon incompatibility domain-containing protein n=1 Tax=Cladobotryum mycophilum TaxID=491253 RepID=A0ABR0SW26_9HYPO
MSLSYYLPGRPKCISDKTKAIHSCLSTEIERQNLEVKAVFTISFEELSQHHKSVDILAHATPERHRLLDCAKVVHDQTLRVLEFDGFPSVQYASLSYMWRGNQSTNNSTFNTGEFSVLGAEDADLLSLEVVFDACVASLACGASYLWLDRVCITQNNKKDKVWQVREMYRIYAFSTICIVLPAWTLQEVVAPPSVALLFAWTRGVGEIRLEVGGETGQETIEVVTPERSAMMDLTNALAACSVGYFEFRPNFNDKGALSVRIEAVLFGRPETDLTVFSVMGLLGATLDPSEFHVEDRLGATISLARQILHQGHSASWLGVATNLSPCPYLSTFPVFPQTSVAGRAMYDLPKGG